MQDPYPAQYAGPPPLREPRRTHVTPLMMVLVVLLALLILPYVAERVQYALTRGEQQAKADVARAELAKMPAPSNRLRLVAQSIAPAVVGIKVVQWVQRRVLGDEWVSLSAGEGSGVIVDSSGYIVTNFHVVADADQVSVELADGRRISDVRVLGADPATDIAVLKVNANGLTAARWGDSDELEAGDEVLAIGNPFRLAHTVTAGIVSAKDRRAETEAGINEFLQTDAAVNPGSSGGPLVNLKGEVVGINSAIFGPTYRGISFAIPSRAAREVYEQLRAHKRIVRGWLGVDMRDLTEEVAERLGLKETRGVVVRDVVPDSPAARAGIEPGDVIVEWGGKKVADSFELRQTVFGSKVGSKVPVVVIREGKPRTLTVEVGERPAQL